MLGVGFIVISLLVITALIPDGEVIDNITIPPEDIEVKLQNTLANVNESMVVTEKKQIKDIENSTHINTSKRNEAALVIENIYEEQKHSQVELGYQDIYTEAELFSVVNEVHEQAPSNLDFSTYGEPIILNQMQLRNLKVKQLINFPLNGGHSLLVENVVTRKSGSVKINFSLPNEKTIYRGFITVGNKSTFGRIITPAGSYELEVINGKGWGVDTRDISTPPPADGVDYLIPTTE